MIQTIYSILKDMPPTNEYPIPVKRLFILIRVQNIIFLLVIFILINLPKSKARILA